MFEDIKTLDEVIAARDKLDLEYESASEVLSALFEKLINE